MTDTYHQGSTMLKSKFARLSALFQIALVGLSALFQICSRGSCSPRSLRAALSASRPRSRAEDTLQYAKATLAGVYKTIGDAAGRARDQLRPGAQARCSAADGQRVACRRTPRR
jgi:hypothetical protein